MTFLETLLGAVPAIGALARRSWCRGQREHLVDFASRVLWVAPDKVPWALWGAKQGFFDAEWAGSLLYLRGR
jgi:hypothetical protein